MAEFISWEEERATKEFVERVNLLRRDKSKGPISWNTAIKFLMARKFDVNRAVNLYQQHELTRQREGLVNLDPKSGDLFSELNSGKFTVLPCRDKSGAAIALFTARLHDPKASTHQVTLQGVVYQLDAALESPDTQRCGLVFIYDMTVSLYQNFDYHLAQKILNLLKGGYPARLKKVLIVTAPLWFRAPFKVLKLFVREKLRDRVYTVSIQELGNHLSEECLPPALGGTLICSHSVWLEKCLFSMTNKSQSDPCEVSDIKCKNNPAMSNGSLEKDALHLAGSELNNAVETTLDELCDDMSDDDSCEQSLSNTSQYEEEGIENVEEPNEEERNDSENCECVNNLEHDIVHINGFKEGISLTDLKLDHSSLQAPPSSGSSGFSDDDSLHTDDGNGMSLEDFVRYLKRLGRQGLYNEYADIKSKMPEGTFDNSKKRGNHQKNRYTDVLCYDHSRVILSLREDDPTSDYINANYVDGYKQKNAFISTQGPLPNTAGSFWRMVWEQNVCIVVMTTRVNERGRTKCDFYWPEKEGSSIKRDNFTVINTGIQQFPDYLVNKILINNEKTSEQRQIEHFQFTSWPDYGVPESALAMLSFLEHVRTSQAKLVSDLGPAWSGHPFGPPIVVHCSAGIGRTGTFCTLDICIKRLEDVGTIDVRSTVEKIRSQRAYSIQMPDQYVFCHMALLEYALNKGKIIDVDLTGFEDDTSESD